MNNYKAFSKESRFRDLCKAVKHCSLCERLHGRTKVLSDANGNLWSKVFIIAEAPGRFGADRTGIPLYGDKTGDNFEALLGNISWRRKDVFLTNALLCNPRDEDGTNGTPSVTEVTNCATYLEMTIELVQPQVIVTLGLKALEALKNIFPHNFRLKEHAGLSLFWNNKILVPLYHPGPRARVHRSYAKQTADFISLAKLVDPIKGIERKTTPRKRKIKTSSPFEKPSKFQELINLCVRTLGKMTYFKLTKLLYLVDLTAIERLGRTLSGQIYLRQQEGPWPPQLKNAISLLDGREVALSFRGRIPIVEPGSSPRFDENFNDKELDVVLDVLNKYGRMDNREIKIATYRTPPMQYVLKQEKSGRDMRKVPIIYENRTAIENNSGGPR